MPTSSWRVVTSTVVATTRRQCRLNSKRYSTHTHRDDATFYYDETNAFVVLRLQNSLLETAFLRVCDSSEHLIGPAFPSRRFSSSFCCPANSSIVFLSCNFQPCEFVRLIPVLHLPPLRFGPCHFPIRHFPALRIGPFSSSLAFSSPAVSALPHHQALGRLELTLVVNISLKFILYSLH